MLKCRTNDGLELDLEASLQYRVQKDKIFSIYTNYGDQEKAILTRVAIDAISDVASNYTSTDFFRNRAEIQLRMKDYLIAKVADSTWHDVVYF